MGAGPDRAIHFPSSPSMDGMLVGRSDERPSPMMVTPAAVDRRPSAFIPQRENECTLFPRAWPTLRYRRPWPQRARIR